MDPEAITKIVAAILASQSASQGGNTLPQVYVERYKATLGLLREHEAQEKKDKADRGVEAWKKLAE